MRLYKSCLNTLQNMLLAESHNCVVTDIKKQIIIFDKYIGIYDIFCYVMSLKLTPLIPVFYTV